MQYSYNLSVLDSIICKIKIEDKQKKYEHGSGVIIQMDKEEYVYIFTAKHCILGKEFNYAREDVDITIYVKCNSTYKEIRISEKDMIKYDDDPLNDRAIIIIKKERNKVFEEIKSIEFFDLDSIPIECFFRGFPAPYNSGAAPTAITVGMCEFIENNVICTRTKLETTVYDEALYNVSGCSGGGIFVFYNNKPYLISIAYEFQELFQRIKVNGILEYNELLKESEFRLITFGEYSGEKDIPLSKLKNEYEKAKSGWLRDRYIPNLHVVGRIQNITENIAQSNRILFNMISSLLNNKSIINESLGRIIDATKDSRFNDVLEKLNITIEYLNKLLENIDKLIFYLRNDDVKSFSSTIDKKIVYDELVSGIKGIEEKVFMSRNARVLRESLENLRDTNIENNVLNIIEICNTNFIIFLGGPGTGKTHALASIVDNQLNSSLPAIILQAKQYANAVSWKEILVDALGISSGFSEEDIWNALEDTASRCEIGKKNIKDLEDKEIKHEVKVLICIDGIDEAVSDVNWLDRIGELKVICSNYRRLRFIISSRPYKFKNIDIKNKINIPEDGDVNVNNIFNDYIKYYDVTFESENIRKRVKWSLRTPFALKLFCEKYSHKKLNGNEKISVTISKLLSDKIDRIDTEINIKLNNLWTDADYIIKNILVNTVEYFINESEYRIEHNKLIGLLVNEDNLNGLEKLTLSKILKYLADYGLLYTSIEQSSEDSLENPITYYEIQIQPLIDYLIAIILKNIDVMGNKSFPQILDNRIGAQQIYSLILLEERNILVGCDDVWYDYCDNEELIKIQSFALANVSSNIAKNYKSYIENLIRSSTKKLRLIVNNLISEVSRTPNHPLDAEFLHNILMSYETPAERDIIWSTPEYMRYNNNKVWEGKSYCICSTKGLELTSEDTFNGLPLIYAWNLTNLDNKVRIKARNELTKWAIDNPKEFYKLLDKVYITNDPQMKEDILLCLLGVISSMTLCSEDLREFGNWTVRNIFSEDKIQDNKSVVIRFVGRIIVEKAFKWNLIDNELVLLARPPYKFNSIIDIELSKKVINKKCESYPPITGDLSWYVIKKAYESFFEIDREISEEEMKVNYELMKLMEEFNKQDFQDKTINNTVNFDISDEESDEILKESLSDLETRQEEQEKFSMPEYSKEAIKFLEMHAKGVGEKFIMPYMFALSVAINYIEKMGWDYRTFKSYGKNEGKEVYGYDIAIARQYWPATHGRMSSVMTVGEKYTWCAIHEIQGYLADRLPYYGYTDNGKEKYMLDDYSVLVDINNAFIGMQEIDEFEIRNRNYPYMPNELVPEIDELVDDRPDNIKNWIDKAEFPDFKPWLISDNDTMMKVSDELIGSWTSIYNYTTLTERFTKSDSILWINSFLVKEDNYKIFIEQLENEKEKFIPYFVKTYEDAYSYPNIGTYMDPATVNLIDWIKDLSASFSIEYKTNDVSEYYDVFKTISKITYKTNTGEELWSVIPSKIIRDLLDISTVDNFNYKDNKNDLVMFNSLTGKKYGNEQNLLCVKTKNITEVLDTKGYRMFWVVKVLREPSLEAQDKYKNFFYDRYCIWIITDDSFEMYKLCDEPKTW